jgi:Domain of unknown function (DUF5615)
LADFYIDNDVALEVAHLLRVSGHTAVTARDMGREGDRDDEQLLVASQQGHIFLTHNETDFVLLHDAWQRWSEAWGVSAHHAGILIVPQGRRYGLDWGANEIARSVVDCLYRCSPISGRLFRRKETGWEHREGRDWIPCQ